MGPRRVESPEPHWDAQLGSVVAILKTHTNCLPVHTSCTQTFSIYDILTALWVDRSSLLHIQRWHESMTFITLRCLCSCLEQCIGKDFKTLPYERLLKELSPHSASMHPKPVTDFDRIKAFHLKGIASLVSWVPLVELREKSALTPPFLLSSQVTQWSVHHSKLSSSPFQGM